MKAIIFSILATVLAVQAQASDCNKKGNQPMIKKNDYASLMPSHGQQQQHMVKPRIATGVGAKGAG